MNARAKKRLNAKLIIADRISKKLAQPEIRDSKTGLSSIVCVNFAQTKPLLKQKNLKEETGKTLG